MLGNIKSDPNADIRTNIDTPSLGQVVRKTVTFDGSAGNGAVGTVSLFNVTGFVIAKIIARCTTLLAGATATIEVGIAGNTAFIIAQSTGTDVDANEIWHDATPDSTIELASVIKEVVINGSNIILTVATADVDSGVIEFNCFYEPLSAGAVVEAA